MTKKTAGAEQEGFSAGFFKMGQAGILQTDFLYFFDKMGILGRVWGISGADKSNLFFHSNFSLEDVSNYLAEIIRGVFSFDEDKVTVTKNGDSYLVTVESTGEMYSVYNNNGINISLLENEGQPSGQSSKTKNGALFYFRKAIGNIKTPYTAVFPEKGITDNLASEINQWNKDKRKRHLDLMLLQAITEKEGVSSNFYKNNPPYKSTMDRLRSNSLLKKGPKVYMGFNFNGRRLPVLADLDGILVSEKGEDYLEMARESNYELTGRMQQADSVAAVFSEINSAGTTPASYFVENAVLERGLVKKEDYLALYNWQFVDYLRERLS